VDIRQILRSNTFFSLISQVVNAGLAFLSFALINRISSYDELGKWFLFLSTLNVFDLIRTGLVNTPFLKHYSSNTPLEKRLYTGATWFLMLSISAILSGVCGLIYVFADSAFDVEIALFPNFIALFWALIPINLASWILQAELRFKALLFIRSLVLLSFASTSVYLYLNNIQTNALDISLYYLVSHLIGFLVVLLMNWCATQDLLNWSKKHILEIYHFGKYSIGTLLGSTLLRNSDVYILGFFLGPSAVSIYSIPFKVVEFFEIPVRSFLNASIPKMAAFAQQKNISKFKEELYLKSGLLSALGIPILVLSWIFAQDIVLFFGASESIELSANLARVFISFAILIPLDRYSGVSLDLIHKPHLNMLKVFIMLSINIIGDLCVVNLTHGILWVAIVSIATFGSGILAGNILLHRFIQIEPWQYVQSSINFIKSKR
jgi:O-antigen/teichoic acid export membrane protein